MQAFHIVLVLNAIWFALGFHLFAMRNQVFGKILVPREHRDSPVFQTLVATGPFLGGFNFAFCLLNILVLLYASTFPDASQRAILLITFAVAHGSQFAGNVPVALQNRQGGGVWQVKGLMGFIFVTDFTLMVLNAALAVSLL